MDIYRKLASYNKLSANLDRRADKKFNFFESRFPAINAKITKYVNRTKQFPDFADIRLLVEEVNAAEKLDLVEVQVNYKTNLKPRTRKAFWCNFYCLTFPSFITLSPSSFLPIS